LKRKEGERERERDDDKRTIMMRKLRKQTKSPMIEPDLVRLWLGNNLTKLVKTIKKDDRLPRLAETHQKDVF
jgi:hypothetical protein